MEVDNENMGDELQKLKVALKNLMAENELLQMLVITKDEIIENLQNNKNAENQMKSPEENLQNLFTNTERNLHLIKYEILHLIDKISSLKNVIQSKDKEIYKLMKNVVNLEKDIKIMDIVENQDNTTDIENAIDENSLRAVKYYYKIKPNIIHEKTKNNLYPLFYACQSGHLDIVRFLISKGAEMETVLVNSPLMAASMYGHCQVADFLIDKGANINYQDGRGLSALFKAISLNHINIVDLLIKRGADITLVNNEQQTPLEYAVLLQRTDIVKYLSSL